jgi:hypothetical protein
MTPGPWLILILDRDLADPKWILATVAMPGDVRPADPAGAGVDEETTAWVCAARPGPRRTHTYVRRAGVAC